jgi:hypothetical protein
MQTVLSDCKYFGILQINLIFSHNISKGDATLNCRLPPESITKVHNKQYLFLLGFRGIHEN